MSVSRRGKKWQVRWVNASGKRCSETFERKADAEEFERLQKSMARRGDVFDPKNSRITVGEVHADWRKTKGHLKPKTLLGYDSTWRNIVAPRWADVQLRRITVGAVKVWTATCTSSRGHRLGESKIHEAFYVLKMVLDHAVDCELIARNPAMPRDGLTGKFLPKVPENVTRAFLNEDELRAVADHAGHYRDLVLLLGIVGLRFNEACGLKGADLDLARNVIVVRRTLSDLNGTIIEQSPKSGDPREVPFPSFLRDALRTRKLAAGNHGYVFGSVDGAVIRHSNFSRRVWRPALQKAGIDRQVRIHDLRGTAASWLIHHGVDIMELAKVLGHSDPSITLKRYGHLYDKGLTRVGQAMDKAERVFA